MKRLAIALVAALSMEGVASAATLFTPALTLEGGGELRCYAANVSSKDRDVTIEVISSTGGVVQSLSLTLLAGRAQSIAGVGNSAYCKVTVAGGKNTVRVSLESRLNGDTIAAVNGH